MKERVKVSLVQFASKWLDRETNRSRMAAFAEQEAQKGANLIVFPELCVLGYFSPVAVGDEYEGTEIASHAEFVLEYIEGSETVPGPTTQALGGIAHKYGAYIIFGLSQLHPTVPATIYNTAVLLGPDGPLGVHHKIHVAKNEKHIFYPGRTVDVHRTELGNIGMIICYDSYHHELIRSQALKGAEIVCAIFAGPGAPGIASHEGWYRRLACVRAKENGIYFLACMRSGIQGKYTYIGHSAIASPTGMTLAFADTAEETVIRAEFTQEELVKARGLYPIFRDRRPELYGAICEPIDDSDEDRSG